jgi:hypothetical protein
MKTNEQFIAIVSVDGRVLHALGPFADAKTAAQEGQKMAQAVEMFSTPGEYAGSRVMSLLASVEAMFPLKHTSS